MPRVIIVRCTIECRAKRLRSRGITSSSIRCSISNGTPGSDTTTFEPSVPQSNHIPGAVPWALCSTVQHSGTKACARFSSLNSMPRLSKSVRMCSASAGAKTR